jgi:hypothetical protein
VLPETRLPQHPHLPGSASRVSDHFPVSLAFGSQLAKHSRFRIPEWVARHPSFLQAARDRLAGLPGRGHPVRRLCQAKRAIRQCAVDFIKTNSVTAHSKADGITLGLSVLKAARSASPPSLSHLRTSASRIPGLLSALDKDVSTPDPAFKQVQTFVQKCYSASPLTVPQHGKPNFLSTAKHTLPQQNRTLTHLCTDSGDCIRDPPDMARALKRAWEPTWSQADPAKARHRRLPGWLPQAHPHRSSQVDARHG